MLGELGDQQRLRMLTGKNGYGRGPGRAQPSASERLRAWRWRAADLSRSVRSSTGCSARRSARSARRGWPAEPILCHASISRNRLTLVVNLEEPALSAGRLSLAAWIPGSTESADLGSEASRAGSTLTFVINARRLCEEQIASFAKPADETIEVHGVRSAARGPTKGQEGRRQPDQVAGDLGRDNNSS